jgi:ubiquinol-cytochrome c reductase cytochrome c1 subunit
MQGANCASKILPLLSLESQARGFASVTAATKETNKTSQNVAIGAGILAGLAGSALVASATDEGADGLRPASYPWDFEPIFSGFDHSSLRRGFQVYQQVCAACHALEHVYWRDFVGVTHTEEEVKAMAAEVEVEDGPNDEGEMYMRPGRLSDKVPKPYANEEAARFANGGAYPVDLSLVTGARHNGTNYVFALLTGYRDPPAGIEVRKGLYYNPYFPGGAISMPKMLHDGGVEYEDGTPANASQMAKDVTAFLFWCCTPSEEDRKRVGTKALLVTMGCFFFSLYQYRRTWSILRTQRIVMDVVN